MDAVFVVGWVRHFGEKAVQGLSEGCPHCLGFTVGLGVDWCTQGGGVGNGGSVWGALTVVRALDDGGDSFVVKVGMHWGVNAGFIAIYESGGQWHLSTDDLVQVSAGLASGA